MIGKVILVILWFPLTLLLLIVNLTLLAATTSVANHVSAQAEPSAAAKRVTATAGTAQILGATVVAGDARGLLLTNYLTSYGSPLAPYADLIVKEADAKDLDFRLLVAIAMCESNLGKKLPSHNSFNPFGIAVYTDQLPGKKFQSWEHAITWVSDYLKANYYDRGITNLHEIGTIWAPPTEADGRSWSNCVLHFQQSIL